MPAVKKMAAVAKAKNIPFIFFPKGLSTGLRYVTPEHADFVGIDWQIEITEARRLVHPEIGLQGNLDPRLLYADQAAIQETLETYIDFGSKNHNWIFNLGHGFMPGIPYENAQFLTDWVKTANWKRG
jgi:uroporphyrinogen decarboxylase